MRCNCAGTRWLGPAGRLSPRHMYVRQILDDIDHTGHVGVRRGTATGSRFPRPVTCDDMPDISINTNLAALEVAEFARRVDLA